jgi:hypothetical protein
MPFAGVRCGCACCAVEIGGEMEREREREHIEFKSVPSRRSPFRSFPWRLGGRVG